MSEAAKAFLKSRALTTSILDKLPVAFGTDRGEACIFFGCVVHGEPQGYKARPLSRKDFWCKPGTPSRFWNLDQVLGSEVVYITEGELDACALVEAGISEKQVISVPNGARDRKRDDEAEGREIQGYGYVKEGLKEGLCRARRFVLCVDNDKPGQSLRADLAAILGVARCWFVDWPDGCKDANDMLRADGPEALRELVTEGAQVWPVDGLFTLDELPELPPMAGWDAGFPEWEGKVKLGECCLSVVTGHPGHGKTQMMAQIWFQIAREAGIRVAVASLETGAKPHLRKILRQCFWGRREKDLNEQERMRADDFIRAHYRFMQHPDGRPPLNWLMDRIEVAVVREGCRAVVIDPWNKIEAARPPGMNETDYVGQCLDELFAFCRQFNVHIQILAHPAKMDSMFRGKAPILEDIAGSKHWDNKPDQGFVIHRPKFSEGDEIVTDADFFVRKSRFADDLGYPRKMEMKFDIGRGIFTSRAYETRMEAAFGKGVAA